jgi:hydrogenase maturation protease
MPTTCVLGLGNVLMGDDGWGPVVVDAFEAEYVAGPSVQVVDLGTPGLDLSPWLIDVERVILVDTVHADSAPGIIHVYDKASILKHAPGPRIGPHDPGVKEALLTLDFAGRGPRLVTLIGVVPERTTQGVYLTPHVAAAVQPAVDRIAAQLRAWSEPLARRAADAVDGWSPSATPQWRPPAASRRPVAR